MASNITSSEGAVSQHGYKAEELEKAYRREGFSIIDKSILPSDLIERAIRGQDEVKAGRYETGRAPSKLYPQAAPGSISKIDDAHLSNRAIFEAVTHPAVGEFAAAITGAKEWVQLWRVTQLIKPSGDEGSVANVGWHQDNQYWQRDWEGDLFTLWLALTDVKEESGPMVFVRGSHTWGLIDEGSFFVSDMNALKEKFRKRLNKTWEEALDCLPAGGFSIHDKETIHGSHLNTSGSPRRSFALHLRNERSKLKPDARRHDELAAWIQDETASPYIWRAS